VLAGAEVEDRVVGLKVECTIWINLLLEFSSDMVAGTIIVNAHKGYALFDPGATHSFIACKFVNQLNVPKRKLVSGLVISTP